LYLYITGLINGCQALARCKGIWYNINENSTNMNIKSFVFYSLKIITELILDILYFPAWWYSRGLVNLIFSVKNFLVDKQKSLALLVWIKNIFRPMYAQYDWAGMIISFFVRLVQIIFRSIFMIFWLMFGLAVIVFWIFFPILVIYEIIFQIL
jgi:hypothetical protein